MSGKINNVSFIVIARNEEGALPRCLTSITTLDLADCELICVDSVSTDKTRQIMLDCEKKHSFCKVIVSTECPNAASARNIGIQAASKSVLFFIDGDIEVNPDFLVCAIEELKNPDIGAVTGGLDEVIYADSNRRDVLRKQVRKIFETRRFIMSCGGIYIAKAKAIKETGLYDERFFRSQDIDYALRLTARFKMVALPMSMGIHHTGEYLERPWRYLVDGHILNQGMLARKHAFRRGFWGDWYATRKGYVWGFIAANGLLVLLVLTLLGLLPWHVTAVVAALLLGMEWAYAIIRKQTLYGTLITHLLSPYGVLIGFCVEPFIHRTRRNKNRSVASRDE